VSTANSTTASTLAVSGANVTAPHNIEVFHRDFAADQTTLPSVALADVPSTRHTSLRIHRSCTRG
jgi:hypothetical protein